MAGRSHPPTKIIALAGNTSLCTTLSVARLLLRRASPPFLGSEGALFSEIMMFVGSTAIARATAGFSRFAELILIRVAISAIDAGVALEPLH